VSEPAARAAAPPVKTRIMPEGHWDWPLSVTLSQGWKIGPWVFVGGQVAQDADGVVLHPGDIAAQIRVVFENIRAVLVEAGGDLADIVKLNTYYVYDGPPEGNDEFYKMMTRVRMEYIADPGPAATAVRVAGLALLGLEVEIEAIAYIDEPA
jgi:enamine deaminase RidA (YjgF/YER057c/UK114 family)